MSSPHGQTGLFITFEGIDGAGKSTHIDGLAGALRAQGRAVTLTREPGGTPLAERLRDLVLAHPMDALTETLLVFAARRDHLRQVIMPALARGEVVLCDRFTDATFAYQGSGRGFDLGVLSKLERWVQEQPRNSDEIMPETNTRLDGPLCQPELTIWFDLPPELAAQRRSGARTPDRFEAQPVDFFRRVAEGYTQRAAEAPRRFVRIDATQERHQVWQQLVHAFVYRGWLAAGAHAAPPAQLAKHDGADRQ